LTRTDIIDDIYPVPGPLLIILSGLSGAGKDAVLNCLRQSSIPLEYIVTLTTRLPRPGEIDGIHYRFVSQEHFTKLIQSNELLEWAEVYGNYYGSPRGAVRNALAAGKDVILKVDVQGASNIKKLLPESVAIFLATPTMKELETRLRNRRTESVSDLELRLKTAKEELKKLDLFDYLVFNHEGAVNQAAVEIQAIITAEKRRVKPRKVSL